MGGATGNSIAAGATLTPGQSYGNNSGNGSSNTSTLKKRVQIQEITV